MRSLPAINYSKIPVKYRLEEELTYTLETIELNAEYKDYFTIRGRTMIIRKGYAWDGASGPTVDTRSNMLAGCVHDVLYQCIRLGIMSHDFKHAADRELYHIMRAYGQQHARSRIGKLWAKARAWLYYKGVVWFGNSSTKPRKDGEAGEKVFTA